MLWLWSHPSINFVAERREINLLCLFNYRLSVLERKKANQKKKKNKLKNSQIKSSVSLLLTLLLVLLSLSHTRTHKYFGYFSIFTYKSSTSSSHIPFHFSYHLCSSPHLFFSNLSFSNSHLSLSLSISQTFSPHWIIPQLTNHYIFFSFPHLWVLYLSSTRFLISDSVSLDYQGLRLLFIVL